MPTSIRQIMQYKQQGHPITALTAWDYCFAQILDQAGVDLILVGDSMAMVALGHTTTLPLTLEETLHHAKAVRRGVKEALVVCDLPFMSYQESPQQALRTAGRCLKEAGMQAVKLEGGYPAMAETVRTLVQAGVPVLGHLGVTPQSINQQGLRQQGRSTQKQEQILQQAMALEQAGAFALVLEHITPELAGKITQTLTIPTIGIGAGSRCDGQILVTADLLGLSAQLPPFAQTYTNFRELTTQAVQAFRRDVQGGMFRVTRG
jgi:3-methyl-2-oxobutanoate hydroxymethyltransferase